MLFFFFFFNDTATTEIYTLSLHDALPIYAPPPERQADEIQRHAKHSVDRGLQDRKSTRLNSSHSQISYAVFCLKKKKKNKTRNHLVETHNITYPEHNNHPTTIHQTRAYLV